MKKIFISILLLSSCVFASGWKSYMETNIPIAEGDLIESCTNSFGTSVIKKTTAGTIYFYLLNENGYAAYSVLIDTYASLANITSNDNTVYVVYKKNSVVKTKYSNNGGATWNTLVDYNYDVQDLDAVFYDSYLQVAYKINNAIRYTTYYSNSWTPYISITGVPSSGQAFANPLIKGAKTSEGEKYFSATN